MDQGSPSSIGSIQSAHRLCHDLGRPFRQDPPRSRYQRGWGSACSEPKPISTAWPLTVQDLYNHQNDFIRPDWRSFTAVSWPIYSERRHNRQHIGENFYTVQAASDTNTRIFNLYLNLDGSANKRSYIAITEATTDTCTTSSLLKSHQSRHSTISKRRHRLTHASDSEHLNIFQSARWLNVDLWVHIERL